MAIAKTLVLFVWLLLLGSLPAFGFQNPCLGIRPSCLVVCPPDFTLATCHYDGHSQADFPYDASARMSRRYDGPPIHTVAECAGQSASASKYPDLAENILNAQQAGNPQVLTAGGDIAANRAAALEGVPNISGLSRDEYPFASSMEGGEGAWVGHIPVSQQNAQGALIKNFMQANNITPGSQYKVVIVP